MAFWKYNYFLFSLGTIMECLVFKWLWRSLVDPCDTLNLDEQVRHLALEFFLSNRKCNQTLDLDFLEMSSKPSFPCFNSMCLARLLLPLKKLLQSEGRYDFLISTWSWSSWFRKITKTWSPDLHFFSNQEILISQYLQFLIPWSRPDPDLIAKFAVCIGH